MDWRIDGGGGHELDVDGCTSKKTKGRMSLDSDVSRSVYVFGIYPQRNDRKRKHWTHTHTLLSTLFYFI